MNDLLKELTGTICRCGKPKATRQTFCRVCYFQLPKKLRLSLYNRMGNGYEEAYTEAVKVLEAA